MTHAEQIAAIDPIQVLALYQVLDMAILFPTMMMGITAGKALENMGLIAPGTKVTKPIKRYFYSLTREALGK